MTDIPDGGGDHSQSEAIANIDLRARTAAAGLRRATDVEAPDLAHLMKARRTMWLVTAVSKEQRAAVFEYFKNPSMESGKSVKAAAGTTSASSRRWTC